MKRIKSLVPTIFLLFVTFFIFSCSQELTRTKAKKLIVEEGKYKKFETVRIKGTYYSDYHSDESIWGTKDDLGRNYKEIKQKLKKMEQDGVLKLSEALVNEVANIYKLKVVLTQEGAKYLVENKDAFIVKSCEIAFGEVTGIEVENQFNGAVVHYTLVRVNPTPFGVNISQEPIDKKALFSKYDDGWRINN